MRTAARWLDRLGLNRIQYITPGDETLRQTGKIATGYPGRMIYLDVKKVRGAPRWWRLESPRPGQRPRACLEPGDEPEGRYTYLHSVIDGSSRLVYTEALEDERPARRAGSTPRAVVFFAAHCITRIVRVMTDNGNNDRAQDFTRTVEVPASCHQRIRPYAPRHNGKVERHQWVLAEECLYARAYEAEEQRREAIAVWVHPRHLSSASCRLRRSAPNFTLVHQRRQRHDQNYT